MPTIYDVAKRAGVSTYTVSAVLNQSARVSAELTTRVELAVRELNYTPNAVARSLQTRVTKSIGMAIPDIGNPFYASFVRGLESRLRQDGYSVLLTSSHEDDAEQAKQLANFKARQVDGLVVVMVSGSEQTMQSLMAEPRPVVFSARIPVTFEADSVAADNVLGARLAIDHLIAAGHRRIALVTGDLAVSTGADRALGWRQALEAAGLEASADLLAVGDWTAVTGYRLTQQLMSMPNPPTALFGANFLILTGMLRALRERGLRVPQDVQLASSDDSEWLDSFDPPVTTIAQPTFAIGYESANLLLKRIQDPSRPFERITLTPELKVRASMKRLAYIAGALLVLTAGAVALLPSLVNVEQFRTLIRAELQKGLARDADFGPMRLKLWPLGIALSDFRIAEAADFPTQKPFLTAKEIQVHVDLLPLLQKQIKIDDFEIVEPSLELVRDGERWNYQTLGRASSSNEPSQVRLKKLEVTNGTLAISELGKPVTRTVYDGLRLLLTNVEPGRPFGLELASNLGLAFVGQGNPLQGKLTAKNVALAPLTRNPKLEGALTANADLDSAGTVIKAKGQLDLSNARYKGAPVTAPPLHADFDLTQDGATIKLNNVRLKLANAAITLRGELPKLSVKSEQIPFADLTRLATAFDIKIPAGVQAKGTVGVDLQTEGAQATGTIRATNLELSGASLKQPVRTPNLTLEITPTTIRSRDFVAETAGAKLQADFELKDYAGPNPLIDATIRTDQASIPDLQNLARAYGVSAASELGNTRGTASVDLRITGPIQQTARLRFTGKGHLKDATIKAATVDQANFDFAGDLIKLTAWSLRYQDFALQNLRTTIRLLGASQLKLDPLEADLFGGHHSGAVTVDNREKVPTLRMQSKLDRMDANQLLSRFAGVKQVIFGTFNAEGDLTVALDDNPARSLNGTTQLRLANGKLAGFSLLDEVAGLGKFLSWVKNKEQFTSFVEIAGALKLNSGVASTDALRLRLDKATVDTSGAINLTDQTLKLRAVTTLGRALADEVGGGKVGGFMTTAFSNKAGELVIPALVSGSMTKPKFAPDPEAIARQRLQTFEPEKAKEQVKKIFDVFRKK